MDIVTQAYTDSYKQYQGLMSSPLAVDNAVQDVLNDLLYAMVSQHNMTAVEGITAIRKAIKHL